MSIAPPFPFICCASQTLAGSRIFQLTQIRDQLAPLLAAWYMLQRRAAAHPPSPAPASRWRRRARAWGGLGALLALRWIAHVHRDLFLVVLSAGFLTRRRRGSGRGPEPAHSGGLGWWWWLGPRLVLAALLLVLPDLVSVEIARLSASTLPAPQARPRFGRFEWKKEKRVKAIAFQADLYQYSVMLSYSCAVLHPACALTSVTRHT